MNSTNNDNRYPVGTLVHTKLDPSLPLVIVKYYQRIYYCAVVNHPETKPLACFEHELSTSQPDQVTR